MFKLPESVQIGPITYQVKEESRTALDSFYGQIVYSDGLIALQPGMAPVYQEITLFHEILHGMLLQGGIRDHDERVLDVLAHGFVMLLRDNPGLFVKE